MLSNNIYDYRIVSQGKTTVDSIDDVEEMQATEVRRLKSARMHLWMFAFTSTMSDFIFIHFTVWNKSCKKTRHLIKFDEIENLIERHLNHFCDP